MLICARCDAGEWSVTVREMILVVVVVVAIKSHNNIELGSKFPEPIDGADRRPLLLPQMATTLILVNLQTACLCTELVFTTSGGHLNPVINI